MVSIESNAESPTDGPLAATLSGMSGVRKSQIELRAVADACEQIGAVEWSVLSSMLNRRMTDRKLRSVRHVRCAKT